MRWGVLAALLAVAACGSVEVDESTTSTAGEPTPTLSQDVTDRIMADARERFPELEPDEPRVLSVEPRTYEDSSLGCPDDGGSYEEVTIEGFQLILEATENQLDYRVGESGEFVLCISKSSSGLAEETEATSEEERGPKEDDVDTSDEEVPDTMGLPPELANAIIDDAAVSAGIPSSEVSLVSVTSETFNDGSLGCPRKDESYIQVITPGWIVMVEAGSTVLEYHASQAGAFVLCS